jgi:glycosyltransferase involved in cell wall biosynthesis
MPSNPKPRIAVLIPCYNEEHAIAKVVSGFQAALPDADIYVYDNNSSDKTCEIAIAAGAIVRSEPAQGKGNVIRRMFSDITADFYVLIDGDGTYAPADAPALLELAQSERLDMVAGKRQNIHQDAGRSGHAFGNRLFNFLFRKMFRTGFDDIFTGYRVFSKRFVKSFPALSTGFETETELCVHALTLRQPFAEVEVSYGLRQAGSDSKLSTFRDGFRILKTFVLLMKEVKPLAFFGYLALLTLLAAAIFGVPVLAEYFDTGLVLLLPRWILAVGLASVSLLLMVAGLILDSVARGRVEHKRLVYLQYSVWNPED